MKTPQNKRILPAFLMTMLYLLPAAAPGQALSVLGGDQWAQSCYDNAEYAARNTPIVSRSLLQPCDQALDYGTLSLADRAATLANRGIIRAANGNIDGAMADYAKAVAIRPQTAEIYVNRGNAYFLDRDYAMALEDYERSLELGIRQVDFVRYNMGMTYEKLGNDEAAEAQLRMALELQPDWELARNRLDRLLARKAEEKAETP